MKLKRKIYEKLSEWKKTSSGKTALLIEGARRIGKSYIAQDFASNEYKSFLHIDFSEISDIVKGIFNNNKDNLDIFFNKLSIYYDIDLYTRESLIIFDKIQLYPIARNFKDVHGGHRIVNISCI